MAKDKEKAWENWLSPTPSVPQPGVSEHRAFKAGWDAAMASLEEEPDDDDDD